MKKKIEHKIGCAWLRDDGSKCDCGFANGCTRCNPKTCRQRRGSDISKR